MASTMSRNIPPPPPRLRQHHTSSSSVASDSPRSLFDFRYPSSSTTFSDSASPTSKQFSSPVDIMMTQETMNKSRRYTAGKLHRRTLSKESTGSVSNSILASSVLQSSSVVPERPADSPTTSGYYLPEGTDIRGDHWKRTEPWAFNPHEGWDEADAANTRKKRLQIKAPGFVKLPTPTLPFSKKEKKGSPSSEFDDFQLNTEDMIKKSPHLRQSSNASSGMGSYHTGYRFGPDDIVRRADYVPGQPFEHPLKQKPRPSTPRGSQNNTDDEDDYGYEDAFANIYNPDHPTEFPRRSVGSRASSRGSETRPNFAGAYSYSRSNTSPIVGTAPAGQLRLQTAGSALHAVTSPLSRSMTRESDHHEASFEDAREQPFPFKSKDKEDTSLIGARKIWSKYGRLNKSKSNDLLNTAQATTTDTTTTTTSITQPTSDYPAVFDESDSSPPREPLHRIRSREKGWSDAQVASLAAARLAWDLKEQKKQAKITRKEEKEARKAESRKSSVVTLQRRGADSEKAGHDQYGGTGRKWGVGLPDDGHTGHAISRERRPSGVKRGWLGFVLWFKMGFLKLGRKMRGVST